MSSMPVSSGVPGRPDGVTGIHAHLMHVLLFGCALKGGDNTRILRPLAHGIHSGLAVFLLSHAVRSQPLKMPAFSTGLEKAQKTVCKTAGENAMRSQTKSSSPYTGGTAWRVPLCAAISPFPNCHVCIRSTGAAHETVRSMAQGLLFCRLFAKRRKLLFLLFFFSYSTEYKDSCRRNGHCQQNPSPYTAL